MDAAIWGFIGVLAGALITGIVTIRAEQIRADKDAALDSAKRQDDRRLGRDNFQRETLLRLQDAINAVARSSVQIHHHEVTAKGSSGVWRGGLLPPDIDAAAQQASLLLSTLRSRVADHDLRSMADQLLATSSVVGLTKVEAEADAALLDATKIARAMLDRSGELIRTTFIEPKTR